MAQPIIVTLPHRLGKDEALRRLKASFSDAQSSGAGLFVFKNQWSGDHLDFRASLLGQSTTGTVDVAEDHVRLEVQLGSSRCWPTGQKPWWRSRASSCWRSRLSPPLREADKLAG